MNFIVLQRSYITFDVIKSTEIEGEILDIAQIRSSLARRLGLKIWCILNKSFYSFLARSISRFPGGPSSRSTVKPTACIALRTLPFAE